MSEVLGSIPGRPHTSVSPSADSRGTVVSYWRKYVHEVLVNRLGGLSLPGKSVVRVNDRPDMTLDVYRGRKTTTQQQDNEGNKFMCPKAKVNMTRVASPYFVSIHHRIPEISSSAASYLEH